jgi:hypothetical protein
MISSPDFISGRELKELLFFSISLFDPALPAEQAKVERGTGRKI